MPDTANRKGNVVDDKTKIVAGGGELLVTAKRISELLNVCERTIRDWQRPRKRGEPKWMPRGLPVRRLGYRTKRYLVSEVMHWATSITNARMEGGVR